MNQLFWWSFLANKSVHANVWGTLLYGLNQVQLRKKRQRIRSCRDLARRYCFFNVSQRKPENAFLLLFKVFCGSNRAVLLSRGMYYHIKYRVYLINCTFRGYFVKRFGTMNISLNVWPSKIWQAGFSLKKRDLACHLRKHPFIDFLL